MEMTEDYTIEQLEKTFKKKYERNLEIHEILQDKYFDEFNKTEEEPFFDICAALHVMCREINQINRMKSEEIRCKSMNRFSQLPTGIE